MAVVLHTPVSPIGKQVPDVDQDRRLLIILGARRVDGNGCPRSRAGL